MCIYIYYKDLHFRPVWLAFSLLSGRNLFNWWTERVHTNLANNILNLNICIYKRLKWFVKQHQVLYKKVIKNETLCWMSKRLSHRETFSMSSIKPIWRLLYIYIYTILVHCRSIWVICVWGLETREKARLRRAFSRVSRRIHIFTYMLRQCTCIVFILQF